jgi:hypothetical protein
MLFLVCAKSKFLASLVMSGINLKRSFVFDLRMAFLRTGLGIQIAEPLKPMVPFSSGTGMFETSWRVSHLESSLTVRMTMLQFASAVFTSANNKIEEEHNKINWRIVEKNRKQISTMIVGVGCINSMEDIAMTCANICGVQIANVNIAIAKLLLYQFAINLINFMGNKKNQNLDAQ